MNFVKIKSIKIVIIYLDFVLSLDVTKIDILTPVKHGKPLCLKCVYRLNRNEEFRGVRWYKNDDIIFSYAVGDDFLNPTNSKPYKFTYDDASIINASILDFLLN